MKKYAWTASVAVLPSIVWWLGGFDFDNRGPLAVCLGLTTIYAAGVAWWIPSWGGTK